MQWFDASDGSVAGLKKHTKKYVNSSTLQLVFPFFWLQLLTLYLVVVGYGMVPNKLEPDRHKYSSFFFFFFLGGGVVM